MCRSEGRRPSSRCAIESDGRHHYIATRSIRQTRINHGRALVNAPPNPPFYSDLSYDFSQFAVFGEATYRFNPNWALTAGLRYYDFSEDRTLTFAGLFADVGYDNVAASVDSDGFSPRVILAYNVNKNVQFTAQYSRGFRLGGINDPLNVGLCSGNDLTTFSGHPNWDDEFVDNYELGTKTRLADGRVTFNAAVFMTKIKDMQYIADAGTCSSRIILNGDAETPGAEFELPLPDGRMGRFSVPASMESCMSSSNSERTIVRSP